MCLAHSVLQGEKISTILKAANVDVEPYWPGLFAKALEGVNVKDLITNIGSGVGAAPAGAAVAAAPAAAAEKKEDKRTYLHIYIYIYIKKSVVMTIPLYGFIHILTILT